MSVIQAPAPRQLGSAVYLPTQSVPTAEMFMQDILEAVKLPRGYSPLPSPYGFPAYTDRLDIVREGGYLAGMQEIEMPERLRQKGERATRAVAEFYGNENPRPPKRFLVDYTLQGSSVMAWYLDPHDVRRYMPEEAEKLGDEPIMGLNPEIAEAVLNHEYGHGGQPPGKIAAKQIIAYTPYGEFPVGNAFVEGGLEYALGRQGLEAPTDYFGKDEEYSVHRGFVEEMERRVPGISKDFLRAAYEGPEKVATLLDGTKDIVVKYAWLYNHRN